MAAMAAVLDHTPGRRIQRFDDDDRGVSVSRIGFEFQDQTCWPLLEDGATLLTTGCRRRDGAQVKGFHATLEIDAGGDVRLWADRTGSRMIYWAKVGELVVFAPEPRALVAVGADDRLDLGALAVFLSSGMLIRDQCLMRGARRLCGGEALVLRRGRTPRVDAWWRYYPGVEARGAPPRQRMVEILVDAVRRSAALHAGDADVGVFLSGGVDSRAILAATLECAPTDRVSAITWYDVEGGADSDLAIARRVAGWAGVSHMAVRRDVDAFIRWFRPLNSMHPFSEMASQHPMEMGVMAELAARGVRRVFRGDEAFGYHLATFTLEQSWHLIGLRRPRHVRVVREMLHPDIRDDALDAADEAFERIEARYAGMRISEAKDAMYFDIRLSGYLQMSAYWRLIHLDERNVLLDDDVLDVMRLTSERLRNYKILFREATAHLTASWPNFGVAGSSNDLPWVRALAPGSAAGDALAAAVDNCDRAVWRVLACAAGREVAEVFSKPETAPVGIARNTWRRKLRDFSGVIAPRITQRALLRAKRDSVPMGGVARRILALDDAIDRGLVRF